MSLRVLRLLAHVVVLTLVVLGAQLLSPTPSCAQSKADKPAAQPSSASERVKPASARASKPTKRRASRTKTETSASSTPAPTPTASQPVPSATPSPSPSSAAASPLTTAPPGEVRREGETDVAVVEFSGLDIEGQLKTPQLLYFLNRLRAEFGRPRLPHRSFMPELRRTAGEEALR